MVDLVDAITIFTVISILSHPKWYHTVIEQLFDQLFIYGSLFDIAMEPGLFSQNSTDSL